MKKDRYKDLFDYLTDHPNEIFTLESLGNHFDRCRATLTNWIKDIQKETDMILIPINYWNDKLTTTRKLKNGKEYTMDGAICGGYMNFDPTTSSTDIDDIVIKSIDWLLALCSGVLRIGDFINHHKEKPMAVLIKGKARKALSEISEAYGALSNVREQMKKKKKST